MKSKELKEKIDAITPSLEDTFEQHFIALAEQHNRNHTEMVNQAIKLGVKVSEMDVFKYRVTFK